MSRLVCIAVHTLYILYNVKMLASDRLFYVE